MPRVECAVPRTANRPKSADRRALESPLHPDRHILYEAAVQGVEYDLDFIARAHRSGGGAPLRDLREDFCGTAALASAWALRSRDHRAWAVDHDPAVLAWARRHRLPRLGAVASRVRLRQGDVRSPSRARVDAVVALNFSYWVFRTRQDLGRYFRAARAALRPGGVLVLNAFGGTEAMDTLTERRRIPASRAITGDAVPGFTYVWEQTSFNPVDHELCAAIHFDMGGGRVRLRAFTYHWRMWTLPELRELLTEAGFLAADVYVEDWDEERHRPGDVYRRRTRFENQSGWLAYIVGRR